MRQFWISILLLVSSALMAQEQPADELWMEPDRPGMATGTGVMPFKGVMWETGFEAGFGKDIFGQNEYSVLLPSTMFRFGITKFAEVRVSFDGLMTIDATKKCAYDVATVTVGTKVRIFDGSEQYKWIPKTALMVNLVIPSTKYMASIMTVAPNAHLLFSNEVTNWFNIGYDVGVEWDGMQPIPNTFVALCLGFTITDQVGAYVESYNSFFDYGKNTDAMCGLDGGFNFMVHDRVQLDVYAGFDARDPKSSSYAGLGVAWLIK